MGMSFPLKIAPWHWTTWTLSYTWLLRPTRVYTLNGILIGSAVFAGLPNTGGSVVLTRWRQFVPT